MANLLDLDGELPDNFIGSPQGIRQYYRDLIYLSRQNIGRTTIYGGIITNKFIEMLESRLFTLEEQGWITMLARKQFLD